jgi:hypothetical protein
MLYFLLGFTQVTLVSIQSRNYTQGRYVLSFITSICIASIWWFTVHQMVNQPVTLYWDGVGYITGNALGGSAGIYIHKNFFRRKDTKDW